MLVERQQKNDWIKGDRLTKWEHKYLSDVPEVWDKKYVKAAYACLQGNPTFGHLIPGRLFRSKRAEPSDGCSLRTIVCVIV
ncbi:hypothetical protein MUP07_09575 [Candidatus Bathyarchaeota archaeon]|nr:hypothetical protein [Candidatus Bathyarchaeota archaeon]